MARTGRWRRSIPNPEGFPWGSNNPSRRQRLVVALLIATFFAGSLYAYYVKTGKDRTDFSQAQFGARALLHGADPYKLVGRGRVYESDWPVMYPATTYVAAIPFVPIPDREAAVIFVAISTFLLAYGSTFDSWHRLPLFASVAFTTSVQYAQWSTLMTAMLFLPLLGVFAAVKPQTALPVLVASRSRSMLGAALAAAVVLLAISLFFIPTWPSEWFAIIRAGEQLRAPALRLGGFLIALVLLRWRRPEAWLVFIMALMPQSWAWYNTLMLLTVARTYREAAVLSLVSSIGAIVTAYIIRDSSPASYATWGAAMVAFAYLPATIAVLRRPNVRDRAPWLPRVQNVESIP